MKKLLFLGACLVALALQPVMAQTGKGDVVVVRMVDMQSRGKLVIVRPGGKTEELDLNGGLNSASMKEAGQTIQRVVTGLTQEGYTLKSSFSGTQGSVSALIFIKE